MILQKKHYICNQYNELSYENRLYHVPRSLLYGKRRWE